MSTEFRAIRRKRTSSDAASTADGDHRKRRRNRTTQSCLNCHTSKRMCDRKRPCGRCTQLGLTGLCVYEVDDPSQRSDAQDESARLRKRVAELEGVVRELKNKPHPRWVKSGSNPGDEFDKCHANARSRAASEGVPMESQHPPGPSQLPDNANGDSSEDPLNRQTFALFNEALQSDYFPSSFSSSPARGSAPLSTLPFSPYFDIQSPSSAPSTGIATPTEEHSQIQVAIAGEQLPNDGIDLASLLMSYSNMVPCDEGAGQVDRALRANTHSQYVDPCSMKYGHGQFMDGHCGCLNEAASYNVVLELSLRLRRAADVLSRSANHRHNNECVLNQKIVNLDAFATTALGNIPISPNDFGPVQLRSRANTMPSGSIHPTFTPSSCVSPLGGPAISPPSLCGVRSWNAAPSGPLDPPPCDESFMTWEPSRRI